MRNLCLASIEERSLAALGMTGLAAELGMTVLVAVFGMAVLVGNTGEMQ
ncbi:MAG: hypothetical protein WBR26_14240 [Candidatus Acidiferrum sp.]